MKLLPTRPAVPAEAGAVMCRARPPASHAPAAIMAAAAVALAAAACSGSPSSAGGGPSSNAGGSANPHLLSFSHCMRSHGVADFPDPQAGAGNVKFPTAQQLRVSSFQLSTADTACLHLLPAGVDDQFPPAEVPILLRGMLPFASCMRSHGVPNFPDPAVDSEGRPIFPLSTHGISLSYSHSQQFNAVLDRCQNLAPRQLGGIPFG